jgi:hypothetical protein
VYRRFRSIDISETAIHSAQRIDRLQYDSKNVNAYHQFVHRKHDLSKNYKNQKLQKNNEISQIRIRGPKHKNSGLRRSKNKNSGPPTAPSYIKSIFYVSWGAFPNGEIFLFFSKICEKIIAFDHESLRKAGNSFLRYRKLKFPLFLY